MRLHENVLELIGHTPLVRLKTGFPENGPKAYVKLEFFSPTGSIKDRMVLHMLRKAMAEGKLKPGDTVIDNTSGNTGSALGMAASLLGLRAIVTTPEKTSKEKVDLIRSYGVKVIITPTEASHDDPEGSYMVARRLARENGYYDMDQYHSQDNVEAYYLNFGPEIWEDTGGKVTHFVCGIGTGGTFSGAARFLKEKNPDIRAVAVDPEGSLFADYIRKNEIVEGHTYMVEGIGTDVLTEAMHTDFVDEVITVTDEEAFNRARLIARTEGISGGGSSGAVAVAMERVGAGAARDALIIGVFADAGIRYMSKCFNDEWMHRHGFLPAQQQMRKEGTQK